MRFRVFGGVSHSRRPRRKSKMGRALAVLLPDQRGLYQQFNAMNFSPKNSNRGVNKCDEVGVAIGQDGVTAVSFPWLLPYLP